MLNLKLEDVLTNEESSLAPYTLQSSAASNFVVTTIHEGVCSQKSVGIVPARTDIPSIGKVEIVKEVGTLYKKDLITSEYRRIHAKFNEEALLAASIIRQKISSQKAEEAQMVIYDRFMGWSTPEHLHRCDDLMHLIMDDDYDIETLLCVLMASYPLRKRLSYRSVLYAKAMQKASQVYGTVEIQQLFSGLE